MTPSNEVSLPKRQHVRHFFHHHILLILLILIIILNIKSTLLRDRRCARRSVESDFSVNTFVRNTLFWTLDFSFSWRLKVQNQLSIMTLLDEIFFQTRFINRMSHFPVQGLSPFFFWVFLWNECAICLACLTNITFWKRFLGLIAICPQLLVVFTQIVAESGQIFSQRPEGNISRKDRIRIQINVIITVRWSRNWSGLR